MGVKYLALFFSFISVAQAYHPDPLAVVYGGTGVTTKTGTGSVVLSTSPTLVAPALGTPSALVGTNITGTAASLTAGTVTTNANLTGPITSSGNTTAVASQTGTGSTFVMQASPTLTTPNLGTPSALVGTNITGTAASFTVGAATNLSGGTAGSSPYQSGVGTTSFLAPGTAGFFLASGGTSAPTWTAGLSNPMTTLGDFIYGGASGTATRLAGNTTATLKLLSQTGTGSVSAAPALTALNAIPGSYTTNDSETYHLEAARISCTSGGCSVVAQTGSWVSSVSRTSAGIYVMTITKFSTTPMCITSPAANGGTQNTFACGPFSPISSTSVQVNCGVASVSNNENDFNIHCIGAE